MDWVFKAALERWPAAKRTKHICMTEQIVDEHIEVTLLIHNRTTHIKSFFFYCDRELFEASSFSQVSWSRTC